MEKTQTGPGLEPVFDDWQSFGTEVNTGGRGGKIVKDDGWGSTSVDVTYPENVYPNDVWDFNLAQRFGGW